MNENISALRICLDDPEIIERPAVTLNKYHPDEKTIISYAWIPQTVCAQIWVLYEFVSVEAKLVWENSLPEQVKGWIDPRVIQYALPYGWYVRNENGFVTENGRDITIDL